MAETPVREAPEAHERPEGHELAQGAPEQSGAPGSLLSKLRAQRDAIGRDLETVLDVPGHHGLLAVKYRLLPFRRVNQMTEATGGGDPNAELNTAAELLAEACAEILVRDPDTDALLPLDPDHGPTRFDAHALRLFGIEVPAGAKPRDVVRLIFNRDYAVMSVQSDLVDWMRASHAVADEEFAGK